MHKMYRLIINVMNNATLPKRIFFTGVPGSRWSGIAQIIEDAAGLNTSDRDPCKEYTHHAYSGHKGAYFGQGMEYQAQLNDPAYLDQPWAVPGGTRLIKSHDWAYHLDTIKQQYSTDWILMVYRPDLVSYAWWHEAGGFQIKYPDYSAYVDSTGMLSAITAQNKAILTFARKHNATWHHFGSAFVKQYFGVDVDEVSSVYTDCLVTVIS